MIGAIFGVRREVLIDFVKKHNITVGAELCNIKGLAIEKATLMPWDKERRHYIRAVEDFEFLIEPTFRIAVYAEDGLVEELKRRIEKLNFEFDIYGGISDCFLKDIENEKHAKFEMKKEVRGMIPVYLMDGYSKILKDCRVAKVLYLNTFFYQGFNVEFRTKETIKTINGIAVWDINDIARFRKGYFS